jgi:hypothetical protein
VAALAAAGSRMMFGVPGGGPNLDVVGAAAAAGLRFVLTHTETAAAIMAATTADLTGAPGAVLVTRGPGLASAVNGIAHAALDRLPLVVIADTVRAAEAGRVSHQRLDQGALGRSVAKAVLTVGGDQAGQLAARAVRLALAAAAGPPVPAPWCDADTTEDSRRGGPPTSDALVTGAGSLPSSSSSTEPCRRACRLPSVAPDQFPAKSLLRTGRSAHRSQTRQRPATARSGVQTASAPSPPQVV